MGIIGIIGIIERTIFLDFLLCSETNFVIAVGIPRLHRVINKLKVGVLLRNAQKTQQTARVRASKLTISFFPACYEHTS